MRTLCVLVVLVAGCGARTGLEIEEDAARLDGGRPDARPFDAGRTDGGRDGGPDAPDAPDAPPIDGCMPVVLALSPIPAEIVLVVDRSTSMGWALTGPTGPGPSRWSILSDALRAELPRWDASSDLGVLLFPGIGLACGTDAMLDLEPRPDGSAAVLSVVSGAMPGGRTPTASAMTTAATFFADHRDPSRPQAVVLATDGAPNCNGALDARTCRCTGGAGLPVGCTERELCLDDVRTIDVIGDLLAAGVPTYVIGIDGDPDPELARVLGRMAVAGARPNPLDPGRGYYSVTRASDLRAALSAIEASIARCELELELPAPEGRPGTVTIDGDVVPFDPSHTDGWDRSTGGLFELFGPACDRAQDGGVHEIDLRVDC